jgi:hypothetical protein
MIRRLQRDEQGIALITVLLITMIALALVSALTAYAVGSQSISKHDQDWNAALSAAQAGLNDYIYRLNQNGNYWQYSAASLPPDGNLAFKQYVPVPGPNNQGTFRYKPDTSTLATDGTIKLTVTGNVNGVTRTVYSTLRRRSFLDYLYFTNYETKDPALYLKPPDPYTPTQAQAACSTYYYTGRNGNCINISFISQDTINGPLHSNDAIRICGNPTFNGAVTTSYNPAAGKRWLDCGGSNPNFQSSGDPKFANPLQMPPNNAALKLDADGTKGGQGCLYTGPTQFTLNSNGTMTVVSPETKNATNANCGPGSNLPLPTNGVAYVQNVPSDPTDPNFMSGCPYSAPVAGTYPYPPGLVVPIKNDSNVYGCTDGDAFIKGTLKGQLTVGAENDINIIGNTTYASGTSGTDVLGLVADSNLNVFHPVQVTSFDASGNCTATNLPGSMTNPQIDAAILSIQHTFIVPYYMCGAPLGTLNVLGAIAQNYRGPVGTFGGGNIVTGYAKGYTYDSRLKYLSPPLFLNPVSAAWQVVTWGEITTPTTFP